jgi:hypothetical protein
MSLTAIYFELHRRAQETGESRGHTFTGGARLAVAVSGNQTTLTIMRKGKKVGDTELTTFKRDCNVPTDAIRYPIEGQGQRVGDAGVTWHFVAYRWLEGGAE